MNEAPNLCFYNRSVSSRVPLRVAAISFLNPAPLLYDFEHEPTASQLSRDYAVHYTTPAACASELLTGTADLGLIPIASLTPALAIVPGCTIASLDEVRSILLLVKNPQGLSAAEALRKVRSIAADAASRSSQAYARILFEHFHQTRPEFHEQAANRPNSPAQMLADADAALLIGDPALLAREHRAQIDAAHGGQLLWLDLAKLWREHTGLPWVAAVWAIRPEALGVGTVSAQSVCETLAASRDAGMAHVPQLVQEWTSRLAVPPTTIHAYLTRNIHYVLDEDCVEAIVLFRKLAAGIGALEAMPELRMLGW
jgi:chorismate dehydratase